MTKRLKSIEILVAQSEKREALGKLMQKETPSPEEASETKRLAGELASGEKEYREAIAAEEKASAEVVEHSHGALTKEEREVRELRSKVNLGAFISQRLSGRDAFGGVLGEYVSACGVQANEIPVAMFEREVRAITDAPSKASQTLEAVSNAQPAVEYAFDPIAASSLGVELRPVESGAAHFVTVTTPVPADAKAKSGALPSTAAVLALLSRKPVRIGGSFEIAAEDEALYPALGDDLDIAASAAVADELDDQIITGNGSSPNLSGLIHQADDVTAASAVEDFETGVSRFGGLFDGLHCQDWGDIRALIGPQTFKVFVGAIATSTAINLYDFLKSRLGSLMVSKRTPSKSSQAQKGIAVLTAKKQNIVVPIWNGMQLRIDDPYSGASTGKRTVTIAVLAGSPFVPYGASMVKEVHPKIS